MKAQTAIALWILVMGGAVAQAQIGTWMGVGPQPGSGTVAGAPFSADVVYSLEKNLAGAAASHLEYHGKAARDSEGRTIYDMELVSPVQATSPRPMRISIWDPVKQTVANLDPQQKMASISRMSAYGPGMPLTPGSAAATGVMDPSRPHSMAATVHGSAPTTSSMATAAGTPAPAASTSAVKTEALGTKTIEGLAVTGVRTIRTVHSGAGDSGKDFVSTTDTWTAPELKLIVLSDTQDSMGVHHVAKLVNIVRTEPEASLFQIPAGYTVRDYSAQASTAAAAHTNR